MHAVILKIYSFIVFLTASMFVFNSSASAISCQKLLNPSIKPSSAIENIFLDIDQKFQGAEFRAEWYITSLSEISKSNSNLDVADLYYIANKVYSVAGHMDPKQLSEIFTFFARFNFSLPAPMVKGLTVQIKEKISLFSPLELTYLLSGIAAVDLFLPSSFQKTLDDYFISQRGVFTSENIMFFSMHYSRIYSIKSSLKVVTEIQKAFIGIHNQFDSDQTLNLLKSIVYTYVKPNKRFLRLALKQLESTMTADRASQILSIFTNLNIKLTDEFKESWLPYLLNNIGDLEPAMRIKVAYDLYLLGEFEAVRDFASSKEMAFSEADLDSAVISQIHIIELYFLNVLKSSEPVFQVDVSQVANKTFEKPSRSSEIENKVEAWLRQQNAHFIKEYQVLSGNHVDFYIPDTNTIIQVDGPHHFIRMENGQHMHRVNDLRFNELHEALGYKVIRVDYRDIP